MLETQLVKEVWCAIYPSNKPYYVLKCMQMYD